MRIRGICCVMFAALVVTSVFVTNTSAATTTPPRDLELLMEIVDESDDACWRKPALQLKCAMNAKLQELAQMMSENEFDEAYSKLLHDIKPKLTGLRTDENEEPWAGREFPNPWVTCTGLGEQLRVISNRLLTYLKTGEVDSTPPTIDIAYTGEYHEDAPGYFTITIKDLESGLDEVLITLSGLIRVHDQGLAGIDSVVYLVDVPGAVGIYTIYVQAVNCAGLTTERSEWLEILLPPPPEEEPPIIIIGA